MNVTPGVRYARLFRAAICPTLVLLVVSWAPLCGVDSFVVALAAILTATLMWVLPTLPTLTVIMLAGHAVVLANAEKVRDSGSTLLWQDISYAVPNIADNIGTFLQYGGLHALLALMLSVFIIAVLTAIERKLRRPPFAYRFILCILLTLLYLPRIVDLVLDTHSALSQFQASPRYFAGNTTHDGIARFIHSMRLPEAKLAVSPTASPALFVQRAADIQSPRHLREPHSYPDIYMILNESQFVPATLVDCVDPAQCGMRLYGSGWAHRLGGPLRVHTVGWGTWNAEFSLMTGLPYYWFGETGFYSPYVMAPKTHYALPKHLASLGYSTLVVYPVQRGMLNASNAYHHYGMQTFLGAEVLKLPWEWCKISDAVMYEHVNSAVRNLRSEHNRPVLVVMLTIYNHGPHGKSGCTPTGSPGVGDALSPSFRSRPEASAKLQDYVNRTSRADTDAVDFVSHTLSQERPTILLFAGDHQPSFEGLAQSFARRHSTATADDPLKYTQYTYIANYALPRLTGLSDAHTALDISFLAAATIDLAQLPADHYFSANSALREMCSGRLEGCEADLIESYKAHLLQLGAYH